MGEPEQHECPNCRRLEKKIAELEQQIQKLTAALEEVRRAGKRQAAPFRKPRRSGPPKKPGRKPGEDYGRHQRRAVPTPEEIDEVHEAPLPSCCPGCGNAALRETDVQAQYQIELPRRPVIRLFRVHRGRCQHCRLLVQGRHALQTSDALGAAAVQLGPQAHAAAAVLNKELGLSHGKVAQVFPRLFGFRIARSTSARSLRRTARRLLSAGEEIQQSIRGSPWLVPDETGWRIGGQSAWLHVAVGAQATWYGIDPGRSADVLAEVIGWDWSGVLVRDGWAPYDRFRQALHQQCLRHILRRCQELQETSSRGAARFPQAVADLLRQALAVRDRFATGEITSHGQSVLHGRLRAALRRQVQWVKTHPGNERLAAFLERHLESLFTFLARPDVDATNWRAEQAIRPAVVNRKVWGGNRTQAGAADQSLLMSVLRTCQQQARDALAYLADTLCSPTPLPLLSAGR